MASTGNDRVVSSDDEELVRVDEHDQVIGRASKAACHSGDGLLHRAFSLFIFNSAGELILQRRSKSKRLWPGYWANSCCSHPRQGEVMDEAVHRRLDEELGLDCPLEYLFTFQYHARFGDEGAEHEVCQVFVGTSDEPARPNPNEIEEWRFVTPAALDDEIAAAPERFTPWLKLEWERLRRDFADRLRPGAPGRPVGRGR